MPECVPADPAQSRLLRCRDEPVLLNSVVLGPSTTIRCGDFIVIRLADRYYGQEIESMQRDRVNIDEAHGGVIGIQTALRRSDVGLGNYVFVRPGRGISLKESIASMINEGCPNCD